MALAALVGSTLSALSAPLFPPPPASPLNVAIVWHHHEPFYPKRPGENVYTQPWVRLRAARDYLRMAHAATAYPGVKVTFNLTPSLLLQLEDLARGAKDRAFVLSSIDSRILTPEQKAEIRSTFFAASPEQMKPLPAYALLGRKEPREFTEQDWRDLQVYFNLAWLAPEVLREPRMAALVRKGRGYGENDKLAVLQRHSELVREVIPAFASLARTGRIEVTTSPYAHPILPILTDSDVVVRSDPRSPAFPERYRYPEDAKEHLDRAIEAYKRLFGQAPRGMWPAEGAVSQAILPLFRQAGVSWIATDERILEKTLGMALRRNGALVRPDLLTRSWRTQDGPYILFRDRELSERIGHAYASWDPVKAARDLAERIRDIARRIPRDQAAILGIILDGAATWDRYPDSGDAFLRALYAELANSPLLRITTPTEFFARTRARPLPGELAAGSWVDGTLSAWTGDPDQRAAWALLAEARAAVADYGVTRGKDRRYAMALEAIRPAQGSDWFGRYGKGREFGQKADFDQAFRYYLTQVYRALGRPVPEALHRPVGTAVPAMRSGEIMPRLDGKGGPAWANAIEGRRAADAGPRGAGATIRRIQVGGDRQHLYLGVDFESDARPTGFVLGFPDRPGGVARAGLPFLAHFIADFQPEATGSLNALADLPMRTRVATAWGPRRLEAAIPWEVLGVRGGEDLAVSALELGATPYPDLPVHVAVPPLADRTVVGFDDPAGDVRGSGSEDIIRLAVEDAGRDWTLVWTLARFGFQPGSGTGAEEATGTATGKERQGPWKYPRLEAYLSLDPSRASSAGHPLLPGRMLRVPTPWRAAVILDGAKSGVYSPGGVRISEVRVIADPKRATIRVSFDKRVIPGNPRRWGFAAVSFSREASRSVADILGTQVEEGESAPLIPYVAPLL